MYQLEKVLSKEAETKFLKWTKANGVDPLAIRDRDLTLSGGRYVLDPIILDEHLEMLTEYDSNAGTLNGEGEDYSYYDVLMEEWGREIAEIIDKLIKIHK